MFNRKGREKVEKPAEETYKCERCNTAFKSECALKCHETLVNGGPHIHCHNHCRSCCVHSHEECFHGVESCKQAAVCERHAKACEKLEYAHRQVVSCVGCLTHEIEYMRSVWQKNGPESASGIHDNIERARKRLDEFQEALDEYVTAKRALPS